MTRRVLMTADTVGGVWTYALDLVDALAPLDVEVHLATMGRPMSRDQRAAAEASAAAAVHEGEFALEWMDDPWRDVDRAGEWLLALAAEIDAGVVHLNGFVHTVLPWCAPTVCVAHSDVLSWWSAVRGTPPPREPYSEYRRRVTAGIRAADALVAPSGALADAVSRLYGRRPAVIHNGRRSGWVRSDISEEPLVLGAGRVWDEAKNLATLARVAPRLSWPLVIAGEGDGDGGIAAPFLGRLPFEELAEWLRLASIFALPARYEPFGLGPLEAAMSGCALVLGDIDSLREIWDDAALFVPPDDEDALVDALERLAVDSGLRARFATRALDRAELYTSARMAARYAALYDEVVSVTKVPAPT